MTMDLSGATKSFPGFDCLYCMKRAHDDKYFYADLGEKTPHTELLRGEWVPESTLQAHWAMERPDPEDVAFGTSTAWFYLSPKVQKLFIAGEVTGWSTYPIALHNKAGKLCPGYAGLSITGRCGPIDQQGGKVVPGQRQGKKFVLRAGLYFDEATWGGSDFFCPAGENTYMFVTDRVKSVFEQHSIEGFEFPPLTEATWYPKVT